MAYSEKSTNFAPAFEYPFDNPVVYRNSHIHKLMISTKDSLLLRVRSGEPMTTGQQFRLVAALSIPAILAQLSHILMNYIDASMVGSLGAEASASIGLVATSIWLLYGVGSSMGTGFSVMVAHRIGASRFFDARNILRQSFSFVIIMGVILAIAGALISPSLPMWLKGTEAIRQDAMLYFLVFAIGLPFCLLNHLTAAMLRCSGNMKFPSMMGVAMCLMDVIFNYFLIFDSHTLQIGSASLHVPGAGLGVLGAAIGSILAEVVSMGIMCWYLFTRSQELRLHHEPGRWTPDWRVIKQALTISLPIGIERAIMTGAQIVSTIIVAPLGIAAIAANSFGITIESLCYMPGYGIGDAATTLVGQSLGAGRKELCMKFATLTVGLGMVVMGVMGVLMYCEAPWLISLMTPDLEVQQLVVQALRIEAFAEPLFAASIICYGVFVGAGDTLIPCCMNLGSIWLVRITLAVLFTHFMGMGLNGVWLAMAIELSVRGTIFLVRLYQKNWLKKAEAKIETT